MKTIITFLSIVLVSSLLYSQSSIVFDAGTIIDVGTGADVCAGTITVNGTFIGGGTFCSGPLPVELVSFNESVVDDKVELKWQTVTEVNNYGFDIERGVSSQKSVVSSWTDIGFVKGSGNSNSPKNYIFVDDNPVNGKAEYRLKQIDNDGNYKYSSVVDVTTLPKEFSLGQNYPNPFNPTTTISFSLPVDSKVVLEVYNITGQKEATLIDQEMQAGNHQVEFNAGRLASGIYYYRITAGSFNAVKKLTLLK